jgi:hypothetical protein
MSKVNFGEVLNNDVKMGELKDELEALKDTLLELNIKTISRMRELIEASYPAEDVMELEREIPLLVDGLTECLKQEMAIRTMDAMLPGWEVKTAERILKAQFDEIMGMMEHPGIDVSGSMN